MSRMSENNDKVHAGYSQFKKAFELHWENGSKENDQSHYLLRFYSVECGFKSMYIHIKDKYHKKNSKDMPNHGHRLDSWIKELTLSASRIKSPPQFKLNSTINIKTPMTVYRAHEAWRYGVIMDPNDEALLLRWLEDARNCIKYSLMEE
jgi:hypothetical protein